jgi:hypothetical protein
MLSILKGIHTTGIVKTAVDLLTTPDSLTADPDCSTPPTVDTILGKLYTPINIILSSYTQFSM